MNEQPVPPLDAAKEYLRRALETDNPEERTWNLRQAELRHADYHAQKAAKKRQRKIANTSRRRNRK